MTYLGRELLLSVVFVAFKPLPDQYHYLIKHLNRSARSYTEDELVGSFPRYFYTADDAISWVRSIRRLPDKPLESDASRRYRLRVHKQYAHMGNYAEPFSLAFSVLPNDIASEVSHFFEKCGVFTQTNEEIIRLRLLAISNHAKKLGNTLSRNWKYYVNWELLSGYRARQPITTFTQEVRDWVSGDKKHTILGSEALFLQTFREGVKECFSFREQLREQKSIDNFLSEFFTAPVSGGFYAKKKYQTLMGGGKMKNKKNIVGMTLSLDQLKQMLLDGTPQVAKTIQKQEPGKVRAVINSNYELYLKMSYFYTFLEQVFKNHPYLTLFQDEKYQLRMKEKMAAATADDTVKVPIDQSHFDFQQNMCMHHIVLDELQDLFKEILPNKEWEPVFEALRSEMTSGSVRNGDEQIPFEKGVLSGWKWTAMLDSIYNYAEIYCARKIVKSQIGYDPVLFLQCMGDDDALTTRNYAEAILIVEAMTSMDFEVNPKKFFMSTDRDEYLRQVYTDKNVSGYPIRALNSVLYRKPTSADKPAGSDRLSEQLNSWLLLTSRGMDKEKITNHMIRDMSRGNNIKKKDIIIWLETPAVLGGAGLYNWSIRYKTEFEANVDERESVRFNNIATHITKILTENNISHNSLRDRLLGTTSTRILITTSAVNKVYFYNIKNNFKTVMPVAPILTDKVDKFIFDLSLLQKETRLDLLKDPRNQAVIDNIERKGSKRLMSDWLNNKLPLKLPPSFDYGRRFISSFYKDTFSALWSSFLSRWTLRYDTLTVMCLGLEFAVREDLSLRGGLVIGE